MQSSPRLATPGFPRRHALTSGLLGSLALVFALAVSACNDATEESQSEGGRGSVAPSEGRPDMAEPESAPMAVRFDDRTDAFGLGSAPTPSPPPAPAQPPSGTAPPDAQTAGTEPGPGTSIVPSMLIRTGNAVIEVDSLEIAISEVRLLAQRLGGFISNTTMQTGQGQIRSATLEMKVPAARFDEAVGGLKPLGKVEAVNESSEDVGEEYVDLTARMTNARRLEERLITLLATRTGKLEDVLAVERELARVREQIERYEGRLRYLRTRAAVSTLTVTVHEPRPLLGSNPGRSVIGEAFREAWRNFVRFIAGFIEALGVLIPLAALGFLGWLVWRRFGPPPRRKDDRDE